jgi:branched-subunit amino acid aminotransferase/4-amino-4-deoxychorismate lyase
MNEQAAFDGLAAVNDKIAELDEHVQKIKRHAASYAEHVQEIDEELAQAMAEGRDSDLPRIIRRRLIPVSAMRRLGDCLRHAVWELEKHDQVEIDRLRELETYAPTDLDGRAAA